MANFNAACVGRTITLARPSLPLRKGASEETLLKRTEYGGRKGRSARKRLQQLALVRFFEALMNNGSYLITDIVHPSSIQITRSESLPTPDSQLQTP